MSITTLAKNITTAVPLTTLSYKDTIGWTGVELSLELTGRILVLLYTMASSFLSFFMVVAISNGPSMVL